MYQLHILLVDVAALDGLEELTRNGRVGPNGFLVADKLIQRLVLLQLDGKAVVGKLLRGLFRAFALGSALGHFESALCFFGHCDNQRQQVIVKVIRL